METDREKRFWAALVEIRDMTEAMDYDDGNDYERFCEYVRVVDAIRDKCYSLLASTK